MSCLRFFGRQKYFCFLFAIYAARKTVVINKSLCTNCDHQIRVLVLNSHRWKSDLNAINLAPNVTMLALPSIVQARVMASFLQPIRGKVKGRHWWESDIRNVVNPTLDQLDHYMQDFLISLKKILKFDLITTCSFYYFQDRAWESAAPKVKIPFVCLHKENQKDDAILDLTINRYKERRYKFNGTIMGVYNRKEKECLIKGCVADNSKIEIVGAPRMDKLFESIKKYGLPSLGDAVTLFSFRHSIGGLNLGIANNAGFSDDPEIGCIKYFEFVHAAVAKFALENPSVPVYIKLKWAQKWEDMVRDAISRQLGVSSYNIPNLIITDKIDAQELILSSRLIIGINTTALLESKILARHVMIPLFEEVQHRHYSNVFLRKYMDSDFIVAKSPDEILSIAKSLFISNDMYPATASVDIVDEFLGFADPNSTNRVIELFKKAIMIESQ